MVLGSYTALKRDRKIVKAMSSIAKMAAFSTIEVTKDDVDTDLAFRTVGLPMFSMHDHGGLTNLHGG